MANQHTKSTTVTPPRKRGGPAARSVENVNPTPARDNAPVGEPRPAKPIKVRATKVCYYGDKLRRVDDVFYIDGTKDKTGKVIAFSERYMELADKREPEKETGSNEALQREHDAILAGRQAGAVAPGGAAQSIPGERRELPPGSKEADDDEGVI